jgi:Regulator of competence-specific genes
MATSESFIQYVCDQVQHTGLVRYRKMFGEYMVYVNDKPILLVCDDTVFVKMLAEITPLMQEADTGKPYEGAKEHYILDIDNREFAENIINILEPITPVPKPRAKKKKNGT